MRRTVTSTNSMTAWSEKRERERDTHIERAIEREEGRGIELLRDLIEIRSGTVLRNTVCSI